MLQRSRSAWSALCLPIGLGTSTLERPYHNHKRTQRVMTHSGNIPNAIMDQSVLAELAALMMRQFTGLVTFSRVRSVLRHSLAGPTGVQEENLSANSRQRKQHPDFLDSTRFSFLFFFCAVSLFNNGSTSRKALEYAKAQTRRFLRVLSLNNSFKFRTNITT